MYDRSKNIPKEVLILCKDFGAFIVGGSCDYLLGEKDDFRDIDVIVPLCKWNNAVYYIPNNAVKNSFGGFKFVSNNIEVDVWCQDLSDYSIYLSPLFNQYAINPIYYKIIRIQNGD